MSGRGTVGFIGLGAMGFGMASHLVKQGYSVKGYDVVDKNVERFQLAGGIGVYDLLESAKGAQHYVCMVATAAQAEDVLFKRGVMDVLPRQAIIYLCSTVPSTSAITIGERIKASREDIFFLDCPVSGGAGRAADGSLSIMVGAFPEAISRGRALLEQLAATDKLYIMPEGPGNGSNLKLAHQVLACCNVLASSEVVGFAARVGVPAPDFLQKMVTSASWAGMVEDRIPRMLAQNYSTAVSALAIILKDTRIITSVARHHSVPTPVSSVAEQQFVAGLSRGWASSDDSCLIQLYFPEPIKAVKASGINEACALRLLRIILLFGVAESVALVHALGLDIDIFYRLATAASGTSRVLEKHARPMYAFLNEDRIPTADEETVDDLIKDLDGILAEAKAVDCPLHMGSMIMNLLLSVKMQGLGDAGVASVVCLWSKTKQGGH
ncbi:NAD binding domain of 6-phosphogluconate dehydrogenase-domain-containing protein [Aspergillus heterothallicus]